MIKRSVHIFTRFERLWHWSQMSLIMVLLFTGFRIHGFYELIDFETAVMIHTYAALILLLIWAFAIFWLFTTGAWKHYLPTRKGLLKVAKYYAFGIFKGERHPYKKTYTRKHNPLQAISYLVLKIMIFPAIWITGLAYLTYGFWDTSSLALEWVAVLHTISAFAISIFIIVHVYLLSTGGSIKEHIKPMITGFDDVYLTEEEVAYLETNEPQNIKPEE